MPRTINGDHEYRVIISSNLFFGNFFIRNGVVISGPDHFRCFFGDYLCKMIVKLGQIEDLCKDRYERTFFIETLAGDDSELPTMTMWDAVAAYNNKVSDTDV